MITEVDGNLLTYSDLVVIGHQTNCLGVMGSGIARQIKNMHPEVFNEYNKLCRLHKDDRSLLGECLICKVNNSNKFVANIFGEYSFTESVAPFENRHTDYDALRTALESFKNWCLSFINENVVELPLKVGIPYKLGCGLAGGDWDNVVLPMIQEIFESEEKINLHIVKYSPF